MNQENKKDPYEFMITKHEFYSTVLQCIGILLAYQCSLFTKSGELFKFCLFSIAFLLFSLMRSWIKSFLDWVKYGND